MMLETSLNTVYFLPIRLIITQTTAVIVKCIMNTKFKLLLCQSISQWCLSLAAGIWLKLVHIERWENSYPFVLGEVVEMLCLKG